MGCLDDDMAMGGGCCTPARDDNVLMALLVYRLWVAKLGSRRSRYCGSHAQKGSHHLLDNYSQGLRGPTHGYLSGVLKDI